MSDLALPTCLNCGYALKGLVEPRCPECGKEFDPAYVEQFETRRLLLPWERPEDGGSIKRTLKTAWLACIHPGYYFTSLDMRRHQPIDRAGRLIWSCVIASLLVYAVGEVLDMILNAVFLANRRGGLSGAVRIVLKAKFYWLRSFWFFPSYYILSCLQTVFLSSLVIGGVARKELGSIRLMNHAAMIAPIIVAAGAFYRLVQLVFLITTRTRFELVGEYGGWAFEAFFGLFIWTCCRKYGRLSRINSAGVTLLCLLIELYSGWPVNAILTPLLITATGTA